MSRRFLVGELSYRSAITDDDEGEKRERAVRNEAANSTTADALGWISTGRRTTTLARA
jgi:hypothetical protein